MNDRLDLTVASWLQADAPEAAAPQVLDGAMARIADLGQERYVTQRLLGDGIGRRRSVRLALALALVTMAVIGGALAIGALVPRPALPVGPLSNGPIVFRAVDAGEDLTGEDVAVRSGDQDLYAVDEAGGIRRFVGDDADELLGFCPALSPDGTHLAYEELDRTTVTPTLAPVPEGATFGPAPSYVGPVARDFAIVALDANGRPAGEPRRIVPPGPPDSIVDCPRWSPDGTALAFVVGGGDVTTIWVATLAGTMTQLDLSGMGPRGTFDWAPDGRHLVVPDASTVWLVPVDGGPRAALIDAGANQVDWSPDGSRIALATSSGVIITTADGAEVFRRTGTIAEDAVALWSPDSRLVAQFRDGQLHVDEADGTSSRAIPITLPTSFASGAASPTSLLGWSPDGTRVLLAAATEPDVNGLISVDAVGDGPVTVVVEPTLALIGIREGQAVWLGLR